MTMEADKTRQNNLSMWGVPDRVGRTPLHYAVLNPGKRVPVLEVRVLLKSMLPFMTKDDLECVDHSGKTVLHYAAISGYAVFDLLIRHMSPEVVAKRDNNGYTYQDYVAQREAQQVAFRIL